MPYKRKRRCNAQSDKQKKQITSRLMEISLKVDDYIYKNKTIADTDAVNYIQEVASYKTFCSNDERCLQVIEKLTRIMKGIIAERQETTSGDIFNEHYTFENRDEIDGSISPVYSIPDEDRTQCTQVIPDDTDNLETKTDKEIIDLCDSEDENTQEDITQGISSIIVDVEIHRGISDLSINPINEATQMTSINNECSQSILNHFENVDINEEEQVEQNGTVTSSNDECSRSILKNIDTNTEQVTRYENVIRSLVDHNYAISVDKTANPIVYTPRNNKVATVTASPVPKLCNNQTLTIDTPQIITSNIQIEQSDNTGINATSRNNKFITASYTQNITHINTNPSTIGKLVDNIYQNTNIHDESHNKNAFANNVNVNLSNTFSLNKNGSRNDNCKANDLCTIRQDDKPTKLNTDVISKDNTQIKKKNTVNVNKKHKLEDATVNAASFVKPTDIKDNKTKPNDNSTTTKKKSHKKKSEETPQKKDKTTFKKPPAKKTAKNKVKQPKKIIQIYNNNTDNDLSWVENIRFVREINDNEYDSQFKFGDDFWDNYSIPGLWDDQDFNY